MTTQAQPTSLLQVRLAQEIKSEAEAILNKLGVTPAQAVKMFFAQIILKKGFPFAVSQKARTQEFQEENASIEQLDLITELEVALSQLQINQGMSTLCRTPEELQARLDYLSSAQ